MKSLHIEMGRHRLGGTMQVYYLLRGLVERGEAVTLVCPAGCPLQELALQAGVTVRAFAYAGDMDLRFVPWLYRLIRSEQPDIIHIHSRRGADTLGLAAAKLAGCGKIVLSRRVDDPVKPGWLTQLRFVSLPDRVVTVSKGIARVLEAAGVPASKIRQVYSAVDAAAYDSPLDVQTARQRLDLPLDVPVLVVVAQLIERKGHRFLLQALRQILVKYPTTRVLFVGEGEATASLQAQVAELGLEGTVRFLGYRNDIGDILRASDILVHPATMEGFANVAMQAMAAGIPVVSSDVGGMSESVRHEVCGLLVPPRDPDALAASIVRLINDAALRSQFGARGKEIVTSTFTPAAMVEGNCKIYRELLEQK